MEKQTIKLRTGTACQVVRLERERFNEAVAGGHLACVPETSPGRARHFDPDGMLALWYYRELTEDGCTREKAGRIACLIADCARAHPAADAISYVEDYFGPNSGKAFPADQVPNHSDWDTILFSGTDIRKVTTFRIGKTRKMIAHYTTEALSVQGSED